jgi:hypothetical protein
MTLLICICIIGIIRLCLKRRSLDSRFSRENIRLKRMEEKKKQQMERYQDILNFMPEKAYSKSLLEIKN